MPDIHEHSHAEHTDRLSVRVPMWYQRFHTHSNTETLMMLGANQPPHRKFFPVTLALTSLGYMALADSAIPESFHAEASALRATVGYQMGLSLSMIRGHV
jgi:hypothetical protein